MEDFIFGTLATDESRIKHLRETLGGITHNHKRLPRDPQPGQPIQIDLTIGPAFSQNQAWIYWTNDGSDPEGKNGNASTGYATQLKPIGSEWDTFLWGYVRKFRGQIPAQETGTLIRYRVAAGGNGEETFADNGTYYASVGNRPIEGEYPYVFLDGIWLRAPYLHNGSVPTLQDLLTPAAERPRVFWRGYDLYDPVAVGFVTQGQAAERLGSRFDTSERANGNQGHTFGTALPTDEKTALIEYLKTL